MNFMDREFNQGFHFVYPADSAQESACSRTGIVAYVWRFSSGASGYQESQGPKCRSGTSAFTSRCGIDENGKYFVYLCTLWMRQGEEGQTGILVHEAAHHAGPSDVTYSIPKMQAESQINQLNNAANYENFAKNVVSGGCNDEYSNCPDLTRYCNQENIKSKCRRSCGICVYGPTGGGSSSSSSGSSGSTGGSGGSSSSSRSSGSSGSSSRGGGGSGGGSSGGSNGCADLDVNCRYYTDYCDTENVKKQCRKTCGLCGSSGGSGGAGSRGGPGNGTRGGAGGSGGCTDLDVNCRYYTDYCDTDNVKKQCRKTCGLCGSGSSGSGGSGSSSRGSGGSSSGSSSSSRGYGGSGGSSGSGSSGGSGSCADLDGNCRFYTDYCDTDNVKKQCKKTCSLCGASSGSASPEPQCADTYGACKWYKDNGYCGTGSVRAQCRRTCGLCR